MKKKDEKTYREVPIPEAGCLVTLWVIVALLLLAKLRGWL